MLITPYLQHAGRNAGNLHIKARLAMNLRVVEISEHLGLGGETGGK